MAMGQVRRDLGFRAGPDVLSRLPDTCGSLDRQTRKRGAHNDRGAVSAGFLCKNGEKEREQKAKR
eukprot:11020303-Heterocapsa_arctica.AAC.1